VVYVNPSFEVIILKKKPERDAYKPSLEVITLKMNERCVSAPGTAPGTRIAPETAPGTTPGTTPGTAPWTAPGTAAGTRIATGTRIAPGTGIIGPRTAKRFTIKRVIEIKSY
jgi:hypothetical protein